MNKSVGQLISVMIEVGIAIELMEFGGKPYQVLRIAKNKARVGTAARRMFESLLKEDLHYLRKAVDGLPGVDN